MTMINAQDLRIGNMVYLKSKSKEYIVDHGYEIDIAFDSDDFEPIPITEKWLLSMGFKKQENNWKTICICNDWTYLHWERLAGIELSVNKHSVMQPHIKYIHQLQNLYHALTGQELVTIEPENK